MKPSNPTFAFSIFIFFLFIHSFSFSQKKGDQTAAFTLYGKIVLDGKPADNVSLELSKNGQPLKKIVTTKNGKYSFVMNQDTLNQKDEYTIHILKEGTVPKALVINTYIPKEQYDDNTYEYVLEITLIPTTVNDVVLQRPSAKIKWNETENGFGIDQVYAKIIQKEEERLKTDPDKYLKELAEKQKKDEIAKNKIENVIVKVVPQNKDTLSPQIENKDPETVIKENLNAIKTELKALPKMDTATEKGDKTAVVSSPTITPVINKKQEIYDGSMNYSLKKDKIALRFSKENAEKKKNTNLATKYETINVMSSLLDAVDEHDKKLKK